MKDFLIYLLQSFVDHPEAVKVEEQGEGGLVILSVVVDPSDIGKVIGREGKVIKALRNVVKILAIKEGKRADINLQEPPL